MKVECQSNAFTFERGNSWGGLLPLFITAAAATAAVISGLLLELREARFANLSDVGLVSLIASNDAG